MNEILRRRSNRVLRYLHNVLLLSGLTLISLFILVFFDDRMIFVVLIMITLACIMTGTHFLVSWLIRHPSVFRQFRTRIDKELFPSVYLRFRNKLEAFRGLVILVSASLGHVLIFISYPRDLHPYWKQASCISLAGMLLIWSLSIILAKKQVGKH